MMTDISIAIVAYNNETDVRKAVCSILEHTALSISKKIYIVDNSSEPNTLQELETLYPEVSYEKTPRNLGFGAGHNHVISKLDSRFHAIVNPDILLTEDSFGILMRFLNEQSVGMAIPRMVDEQGVQQKICRRELTVFDMVIRHLPFGFSRRRAFHTMQDMDYTKPFPVPFAQGSFLVLRTELFVRLDGFDERFFMYVEDADFCRRLNEIDSLYYCPATTVIHRWERASHKDSALRREHFRSMRRYFQKWGWKLW